ncbi:MAG TPA: ATP-binding protein [Bryobacteraceae bacterium]|nr:ATP-binding protein [Bryobacteraceae bacterium]
MRKEITFALLQARKAKVGIAAVLLVLVVAWSDWRVGHTLSLGVLYILPMMLGALALRPAEIAGLAILCAWLRFLFDVPGERLETILRFVFSSLAYFVSGLFVLVLVRNRDLVIENLARVQKEQALRHEAEEQLRALVESSPAAVLTLDQHGVVLAANKAADALFGIPEGQELQGRVIASYLPLLSDALGLDRGGEGFRTAAQCYGRREDGEIFLAHTWFSTYQGGQGARLAAIVVDSSEEMRDREEQNLRQLMRYNRIGAAAVSHEVRNLCGAIVMLASNLEDKANLGQDEDFRGLMQLVKGLQHTAEFDLQAHAQDSAEAVGLREILDNLRIVIEPDWREAGGKVRWMLPAENARVIADPQGLLQAFLNVAQNSHRAVEEMPVRELTISVAKQNSKVAVRFEDTGPGVAEPEKLFQPFQPGAQGSGLGLYVTRAVLRSYGGELRFEPSESGSCFVVELQEAGLETGGADQEEE